MSPTSRLLSRTRCVSPPPPSFVVVVMTMVVVFSCSGAMLSESSSSEDRLRSMLFCTGGETCDHREDAVCSSPTSVSSIGQRSDSTNSSTIDALFPTSATSGPANSSERSTGTGSRLRHPTSALTPPSQSDPIVFFFLENRSTEGHPSDSASDRTSPSTRPVGMDPMRRTSSNSGFLSLRKTESSLSLSLSFVDKFDEKQSEVPHRSTNNALTGGRKERRH